MGSFKKKLKKSILNGADPYKTIKMIRSYRRDKLNIKDESLYDIAKKLHLSIFTYHYIQKNSPTIGEVKDVTAYARKNRILLNSHLGKIYDAMVRGWTDKIEKMRKLANSLTNGGKEAKMDDGKTHELLPLNMKKEKEDSLFKLEGFRFIIGELEKQQYMKDYPDYIERFKTQYGHAVPSNEDPMDFVYKDILSIPSINVIKNLIETYHVDKYMDYFFDDWDFIKNPHRTLSIMTHRKIQEANFISGSYTDYEMNDEFKIFCIILGYCLGVNTTFLLGDNPNPILFDGIVGQDFRIEHIRMKLLHYWDTGVFNIEDKEKFKRTLLNPTDIFKDSENYIERLCKEKEMDPRAISGMYVPTWLNRPSTLITTPDFKADMRFSSDFIKI